MKSFIITAVSKKFSRVTLLSGLGVLLAVPSLAAPLAPGGTLFPAPGEPDPTGGVVLASGAVPFASGAFSGTLTSTVILNDPSNPFGAGTLTFTYRLSNSDTSTDALDRLTISSFAGTLVDASYQIPLAGTPPGFINRSGAGDTIGFTFAGPPIGAGELAPGATSALLVLQTSASAFAPTFASVINASTASVASFAPSPIPEPSTLAIIGLGLVTLVGSRISRRR